MKVAIIGQQDFGKAVFEACASRGDEVVGVFCAPEKTGAKADPLKEAALARGCQVFQFASLRDPQAHATLRGLRADIGLLAYVIQFAPQEFVNIPRLGSLVFHPSLLPRFRGPSSINWPIILGETRTGLSIFRPTDGLDEGPVVLQKQFEIGSDETLGDIYFKKIFGAGVAAMLEAADLVASGNASEAVQDEARASYEGWCRTAEAHIDWGRHVDQIYNLIRGCNPAPGAWTTIAGRKVQLFDSRKHPARRFADVSGKIGEITAIGEQSIRITAQGGQIEVFKLRGDDGKKVDASAYAKSAGIVAGTVAGG